MRILESVKNNPHYLTDADIATWADMTYWVGTEAVMLSLGIDPRKKGATVGDDVSQQISGEYLHRVEVLERMNREEHAREGHRFSGSYVDLHCAPRIFMQWAKENYLSVPEGLYEAVLEKGPGQKLKASANGKKSGGNPGSDAKWAFKYEIKKKAKIHLAAKACDICDHIQLAEYLYTNAADDHGNTLFEYEGVPEETLQKFLKEAANEFLSERAPQRVVGNKGYKKSLGHCDIHARKR